jgi:hypothetical protein
MKKAKKILVRYSADCIADNVHVAREMNERFYRADDIDPLISQLAAANAVLEKLREVVPEDAGADEWCDNCNKLVEVEHIEDYDDTWRRCSGCGHTYSLSDGVDPSTLRAILYEKEAEHE